MKKFISIVLTVSLLMSMVSLCFAADQEPFYYYYSGLSGSYSVSRDGQGKAIFMGNKKVWSSDVWGDDPDEKSDASVSATNVGNEGILPASGNIGADTNVYWIKTAVFPSSDSAAVMNADSGTFTPVGTGTGNVRVRSNHSSSETISCAIPHTLSGSVVYETKVRFDDYNALRYVLSPVSSSTYYNFIKFEKDGKIYAKVNGSYTEVCSYTSGEWYDVKLVLHLTVDGQTSEYFDLYINGTNYIKNAVSSYDLSSSSIDRMWFMLVEHTTARDTITEREFSNAYMYDVRAYYTDSPVFPIYEADVTQGSSTPAGLSRTSQSETLYTGRTYPLASVSATTTKAGYDASKIASSDGLSATEPVIVLQSSTQGADMRVNVNTTTADWTPDLMTHDNVSLEAVVRMEDTNASRYVLQFKSGSSYYDTVRFHSNGKIYVYYKNNETQSYKIIGTWNVGTWYNVKIVIHTKGNLYDVYINGEKCAENLYLLVPASDVSDTNLIRHQNEKADYSTSFFKYCKFEYDTTSYTNPDSAVTLKEIQKASGENYVTATELSTGKYAVTYNVLNNEEDTTVTPFVALAFYKDGELKSIKIAKPEFVYPSNSENSVTLSVDTSESGKYELAAFLWDASDYTPAGSDVQRIRCIIEQPEQH